MGNPHPELQIGIPLNVICAKTQPAKEKAAQLCVPAYTGPLTLLDAVRVGTVEAWDAVALVEHWFKGGGVGRGQAVSWIHQIEAVEKKRALERERQAGNAPATLPETSQEPPDDPETGPDS